MGIKVFDSLPIITVTAKPKDGGEPIVYEQVYDIGHYYARNMGNDAETIRLLIGDPDSIERPTREYIDLYRYDVEINLTK